MNETSLGIKSKTARYELNDEYLSLRVARRHVNDNAGVLARDDVIHKLAHLLVMPADAETRSFTLSEENFGIIEVRLFTAYLQNRQLSATNLQ